MLEVGFSTTGCVNCSFVSERRIDARPRAEPMPRPGVPTIMKASLLKALEAMLLIKTPAQRVTGKVKWTNQSLKKINSVKVWVA